MSFTELFLHEDLMLLAFKDKEGTVTGGAMYTYAIGGAVIAELVMAQRVKIEADRKRQLLTVVDSAALSDPLLDEWLAAITASKKRRQVSEWVGKIAGTRDLKHRVATQLCRRGILRTAEDQVLWIFTRRVYPELDPKPERELVGRLEAAIFGDEDVDPRTAVLIGIAYNCGILPAVFDKKRLKERKSRIAQIADGSLAVGATAEAIEAMQAAIMVAVIIPTVVSTT